MSSETESRRRPEEALLGKAGKPVGQSGRQCCESALSQITSHLARHIELKDTLSWVLGGGIQRKVEHDLCPQGVYHLVERHTRT